jgi:hypothetical protein
MKQKDLKQILEVNPDELSENLTLNEIVSIRDNFIKALRLRANKDNDAEYKRMKPFRDAETKQRQNFDNFKKFTPLLERKLIVMLSELNENLTSASPTFKNDLIQLVNKWKYDVTLETNKKLFEDVSIETHKIGAWIALNMRVNGMKVAPYGGNWRESLFRALYIIAGNKFGKWVKVNGKNEWVDISANEGNEVINTFLWYILVNHSDYVRQMINEGYFE